MDLILKNKESNTDCKKNIQKIYKCSCCGYLWKVPYGKEPVYCPKCYRSDISEIKKKSLFEKLKDFEKRKIKEIEHLF
ncbi:MAG: hypothetical protein B6U87_00795 [Candidatus Aenigmarchaeota archaeon ex4484_52]|nr:MAG: hypothetical protein B6U87_00795 [Candidatus Aenigmarchaeota archaeon ex4484_52]